MKLDVFDKIILVVGCVLNVAYLLHDYKTDPKPILILYTITATIYIWMAIKVWRSE